MSKILSPPTAQDIEAVLTTIRDGTNAYGRLVRWGDHFESDDEVKAEADRLWWVTIIDPDGVGLRCHHGGTSLAEAIAVAWINTCIPAWRWPALRDEDYAKVPRKVPDGWQFKLYDAPWLRPCLCN